MIIILTVFTVSQQGAGRSKISRGHFTVLFISSVNRKSVYVLQSKCNKSAADGWYTPGIDASRGFLENFNVYISLALWSVRQYVDGELTRLLGGTKWTLSVRGMLW